MTVHRGASTPEAQLAGAKRMTAMLLRFPHAIAVDALERWPRTENGKFFPTENELHDLCVRIQRGREPRTAPQQPADDGKFTNPAERAVMVQKLRALTLAMKARNGAPVDLSVETQITRDEFGHLKARFAAQDAKDLAMAQGAGYRTTQEWMAGRKPG